jgi:cytochrome c-type biogenesis protein CcmH
MTMFLLYALLLLAVTAVFLLPPLLRRSANASAQASQLHSQSNLAVLRDQLAELEREHQEGMLANADFLQARQELQRRLLEENAPTADGTRQPGAAAELPSRKTAILLAFLIPLLSMGGYALWGNPRALNPQALVAQAEEPPMSPEQIAGMVDKLAAKLKENPDDMKGWVMLARSYKVMGRYAEAATAYAKAEKAIMDEPELLADYAEVLAMSGGKAGQGGLRGKPAQLIAKALQIDPTNPHALLLAGAAAMESGNAKMAVQIWEKLLTQVEPGSEVEKLLKASIAKVKAGIKE